MSRISIIAAVAIGLAMPATAQDFRAENRVKVRSGNGDFMVLGDGGFGARGIWCAAADYARDRLGARGADRLFVKSPRTRGVGENSTVTFTLEPGGLTAQQVLILGASIRNPGANLSVGHAYGFCADARLIRTR